MTKHRLILGIFLIPMLIAHGAMAMEGFSKFTLCPSESKNTDAGFGTLVPGSFNEIKGDPSCTEQREVTKLPNYAACKKQEYETDEIVITRNPLRSEGAAWDFQTIHHGMNFKIGWSSMYVQSFKTNGMFKFHQDHDVLFIGLPTTNNREVLIRHKSGHHSPEDITQHDIETFDRLATIGSFAELLVPFINFKTQQEQEYKKIQITQHGIDMSEAILSDSKLYACVEGIRHRVDTPFSFALVRNVNNRRDIVVFGKVADFSVLELYRGG